MKITIRIAAVEDGSIEKGFAQAELPGECDELLASDDAMRHLASAALDALVEKKAELARVYKRKVQTRSSP